MNKRIGVILVLCALFCIFPGIVFGQSLKGILNKHDPLLESGIGASQTSNTVLPATAQDRERMEAFTGLLDRLTKILERMVNIFDRITKIALPSSKKSPPQNPPKKDDSPGQDPKKEDKKDPGKSEPSAYTKRGTLNPKNFGFDARYQPVFDLVEKFCDSNKQYKIAAGHTWTGGFPSVTDCSGFTGSFYQKLAALSGVPPVFSKKGWFPTSQDYKSNYTKKITSEFPPTKPRDKIKPGDIFVLNKGNRAYGHIGVFLGYDKSGNPVIAHSTSTTISKSDIKGNAGHTGVRIEVLPKRYASRWSGIYRINGTDKMLDKLMKG